ELTKRWDELASDDATLAYRAIWQLAQQPQPTVALLRQHLTPAPPPDAAKIQSWLADLQHPKFAARDKAFKELANLGELAEPALQKALEAKPDLETRRRIELLLVRIPAAVTSPDKLRRIRALEVL